MVSAVIDDVILRRVIPVFAAAWFGAERDEVHAALDRSLSGFQPHLLVLAKFSRLHRAGCSSCCHEIHRRLLCAPGVFLRPLFRRCSGAAEHGFHSRRRFGVERRDAARARDRPRSVRRRSRFQGARPTWNPGNFFSHPAAAPAAGSFAAGLPVAGSELPGVGTAI